MSLLRRQLAGVRDRAVAALGDDPVVRDGPANLFRGPEAVGGWLALSAARLSFAPHSFNLQSAPLVLPTAEVARAWPCWTWVFGLLPVAPNGLAVETVAGRVYRFVVSDRRGWAAALARPDAEPGAAADPAGM